MKAAESAMKSVLRSTLAAALLASAGWAQAALINYTGQADFGPLAGETFSGSFSYADPAAGFEGPVDLLSFTLEFAGQTYTLATADSTPVAQFIGGVFVGVDYADTDSGLPKVTFTAGFSELSQAFMIYDNGGDMGAGFGTFESFTDGSVPEPASAALLLAGLGLAAVARRRRQA